MIRKIIIFKQKGCKYWGLLGYKWDETDFRHVEFYLVNRTSNK